MYLQSIFIYIIELKVYNKYVILSYFFQLNKYFNYKKENDQHNV